MAADSQPPPSENACTTKNIPNKTVFDSKEGELEKANEAHEVPAITATESQEVSTKKVTESQDVPTKQPSESQHDLPEKAPSPVGNKDMISVT